MSKNRELKVEKVAEIVEKLRNAESVMIVSYSGLTVDNDTALRKQCRESDVDYCVYKNRLVKLALEQIGVSGLDDLLNGPNAFVFGKKDPVSGPKAVANFIEKNKLQCLKIMGGVMDGKAADAATMEALSKMPGRDEMMSMIVGCLNSPMTALVAVLNEIVEKKEAA
ncbi:MAG: 50S ribosomal protein L10 [Clostridia bacterium]|nr:50S ribosomal protein L10 [Clostridia bacterium]